MDLENWAICILISPCSYLFNDLVCGNTTQDQCVGLPYPNFSLLLTVLPQKALPVICDILYSEVSLKMQGLTRMYSTVKSHRNCSFSSRGLAKDITVNIHKTLLCKDFFLNKFLLQLFILGTLVGISTH